MCELFLFYVIHLWEVEEFYRFTVARATASQTLCGRVNLVQVPKSRTLMKVVQHTARVLLDGSVFEGETF